MYRLHVYDNRTTGMHWHIHHDGARHYRDYQRENKRMPVAVALGCDPAITYAATAPVPPEADEMVFAGFCERRMLRWLPARLLIWRCLQMLRLSWKDTSIPKKPILKRPFGDHTGYCSLADYYPVFHITCITQRREPIYPTYDCRQTTDGRLLVGKGHRTVVSAAFKTHDPLRL